MREVEVRQLFLIILNAYNGFAYGDDKVQIWTEILSDVPFDLAQSNLWNYIRNPENKFPPHPGALVETDVQRSEGPYVPNVQETRRMLDEWDLQRSAHHEPIPEFVRERVKALGLPQSRNAGSVKSIPDATES